LWFAATALCVGVGVALSVVSAVHNTGGHFHSGVARGFNAFAFFTIDSNLIVGATTGLLALRLQRDGMVFRVARLTGLVCITVTGVVYHVALAHLLELDSWDLVADQLVHTVVPLTAVVGWLVFGPRRLISGRVVWLSLVFPVLWLAFTLARGAAISWYPYPFVDVSHLGYAKALVNCLWVAVLLLGLAAGAWLLDRWLAPRSSAATAPDGRLAEHATADR